MFKWQKISIDIVDDLNNTFCVFRYLVQNGRAASIWMRPKKLS